MPQAILDIIAENPQIPHVADQVHPTAVQKHGWEKWHESMLHVWRTKLLKPEVFRRNDRKILKEHIQSSAKKPFIQKYDHVGND